MILIAGEALVDIVADNKNRQEFTAFPGGAAYNVACALGRLKASPYFVCPISKDNFGDLLIDHLTACGSKVLLSERVNSPTPLALVNIDQDNQANYTFYRNGTADRTLASFNIKKETPNSVSMLHVTGFCLNDPDDFYSWLELIKLVRSNGGLISIDPNVRPALIDNEEEYRPRIQQLMESADIVKVSDEDLKYLYDHMSLTQAKEHLANKTTLFILTLGSEGAEAHCSQITASAKPKALENIEDTIGAGDCFSGAYLYYLNSQGINQAEKLEKLTEQQLKGLLHFATSAAAINCTRKGCQPPTLDDIASFNIL